MNKSIRNKTFATLLLSCTAFLSVAKPGDWSGKYIVTNDHEQIAQIYHQPGSTTIVLAESTTMIYVTGHTSFNGDINGFKITNLEIDVNHTKTQFESALAKAHLAISYQK